MIFAVRFGLNRFLIKWSFGDLLFQMSDYSTEKSHKTAVINSSFRKENLAFSKFHKEGVNVCDSQQIFVVMVTYEALFAFAMLLIAFAALLLNRK